ncbi:MBL fold metallo-hydrolase [Vibrio sp. JPW-9-11-11]|uniref:MBL fold metallo-hydrolase n=1 Tax=Vibrio sp. JPW-9-11-11 TaxID=1416532 RepID=UPI001594E1BF|nr:MBL fold metallo-hydrolase [Vibrio sp. JPW-9-11-11]NVD06020.1 MBL fold metallo-hydrolase [Vibrio sp. JPW-9-11-11]
MKALTTLALLMATSSAVMAKTDLTFDVYNADEHSFNVTSTLVIGETESLLIDTGFTRADALRIAAKVLDAGKPLTTIFISQADPDYYFGASQLLEIFPDAHLVTTQVVREAIAKKLEKKISFWGPKMGLNAPQNPKLPEVLKSDSLMLDGMRVEVRGTQGVLAHRPYLWVPSEKAILGNVGIVGGMHVWMADTQSDGEVNAWLAQLEEMQSLKPSFVVPGHMTASGKLDASSIRYTHTWIERFVSAKQRSDNSQQVIEAMSQYYPNLVSDFSLELGAKVHMKEASW